jgi:putative folate metabolism gamma-glutamate ligase
MEIKSYRTHLVQPGENLLDVIDAFLPPLTECAVVAISSKVVSICENRIVKKSAATKQDLIRQESETVLRCERYPGLSLAIKDGLLLPAAGIDESNSREEYILHPKNPQANAASIWQHLKNRHQIQRVGVIITDSCPIPLRRGTIGMAIAWCGFEPVYNYIGKPDLYGRPFQYTASNRLDALAAAAVLVMGEGAEQTPLAVIQGITQIKFYDVPPAQAEVDFLKMPVEEDLYGPLLAHFIPSSPSVVLDFQ